jgi:hypothetical protein
MAMTRYASGLRHHYIGLRKGKLRKAFFFEKKNQKTFASLRALPTRLAPNVKSFLLLFFKKEDLSSLGRYRKIPMAFRGGART